MLPWLIKRFARFSQVTAVEVRWTSDALQLNVMVMEKKKGELQILEQQEGIADWDTLLSYCPKGVPLHLSLHGKGVLHKHIDKPLIEDPEQALAEVFPNANKDDLYVQLYPKLNACLVSVVRKELVNNLLALLKEKGYAVAHIAAGPFHVASLLPFIPNAQSGLQLSDAVLEYDEHFRLLEYTPTKGSQELNGFFTIAGLQLKKNLLVTFAGAFAVLTDAFGASASTLAEACRQERENLQQAVLFKRMSMAMLGALLAIVLINAILFVVYFDKANALESSVSMRKGLHGQIDSLKQELEWKEQLMIRKGWDEPSKMAFIADQLAASVPEQVLLSRLGIHPVDQQKSRELHETVFQSKAIEIKGICADATVLNAWNRALQEMRWVKKATIASYQFDPNTNKGDFTVEVSY